MGKKIVIIGAGSSSFMLALLGDIINSSHFVGGKVGLVDIDEEKLKIVDKFARRIIKERDVDIEVVSSSDRRELLPEADYVITTISIGGDEAWKNDLEIPAEYGIIQPVGDTTGPGGISRGLRHIPVIVGIAKDMEKLCPNAWLFNYTNPLSAICRAVVRETSIKCMGLCIGVELIRRYLAALISIPLEDTEVWAAGINHLVFVYDYRYKGINAFPLLDARLKELSGEDPDAMQKVINSYPGLERRTDQPFWGVQPFSHELYQRFGAFPGPGDSHIAEFFPHWFRTEKDRERYGLKLYPIEKKIEQSKLLFEKITAIAEGKEKADMKELSAQHVGEQEQVVDIIESMLHNYNKIFFVNLPNRGYIDNLPEHAIVEVPTVMTRFGPKPLKVGTLPSEIAAYMNHWVYTQELLVDAALSGDRNTLLKCFLSDLSTKNMHQAKALMDKLLKVHKSYLPRFNK